MAWSQEMNPYADEIYKAHWPDLVKIQRFSNPGKVSSKYERFLDQHCHVDGLVQRANGMRHFFQEKFHNTSYSTVTIEYQSDVNKDGEWYRNMSQLHCEGYGDPATGFRMFVIINLLDLYEAIADGRLVGVRRQNGPYSNASFWAYELEDVFRVLPQSIYSYN